MSGLRYGVRLSEDGDWAVAPCMTDEQVRLERWRRGPSGLGATLSELVVEPMDQLLPVDDRVWRCASRGHVHSVSTVDPSATDGTGVEAEFVRLSGNGARLIGPAPGSTDRLPWWLVFDGEHTALGRLAAACDGSGVDEPVLEGTCTEGVWLAPDRLALGRPNPGDGGAAGRSGPVSTVELDVTTGQTRPLFHVSDRSNDRVQAACPGNGLTVVHTDAGGTERLGYALGDHDWRFPDELAAPDGLIQTLTVDPGGQMVLAHIRRGVRSLLRVFDVPNAAARDLPVPPGSLGGTASWTPQRLVVPWTAPGVPIQFLSFGPDLSPDGLVSADEGGTDVARVVRLPGAAGPIEAIAYGGPDWLRRPRLILALHGGPLAAWSLAYDPLLERLADPETAVLAINQRGSTGYGYAFAAAIRSGWAGVDLDDVLSVARYLVERRGGRLGLLGTSYGGYLALAAASRDPGLWWACAARSACSSPQRLAVRAPKAVRAMIEHTGGLASAAPDLVVDGRAATAPVLLVHGAYDETIPVAHARELAAGLGPRARYVELPTVGHDLNWPHVWDLVHNFFTDPTSDPADRHATR